MTCFVFPRTAETPEQVLQVSGVLAWPLPQWVNYSGNKLALINRLSSRKRLPSVIFPKLALQSIEMKQFICTKRYSKSCSLGQLDSQGNSKNHFLYMEKNIRITTAGVRNTTAVSQNGGSLHLGKQEIGALCAK